MTRNASRARLLWPLVLSVALPATGCSMILGIEDLPDLEGPVVRVTAAGLLGSVALELRAGSEPESLTIPEDGSHAFETRLEEGESYSVMLVDPMMPCALKGSTGVMAGEDVIVDLVCSGPSLSSIALSNAGSTISIVPGTTEYAAELSFLQQTVSIEAAAGDVDDAITIAGVPIRSGTPSEPIDLDLGDNRVDIVVENAVGWQRTYQLTLRRAAALVQHAHGKASNTGASDRLGISVSVSGDTLVIGAPFESSDATGIDGNQSSDEAPSSGAVYVFRRTGNSWAQEAYIKASNTGASDLFGWSVSIWGNTLVVGAPGEDSEARGVDGNQDDDAMGSGAVYVFQRTGTAWAQEAYVKASNTGPGDSFGYSVSVSGDVLAVGARYEDGADTGVNGDDTSEDALDSGAVYVFRRTSGFWWQEAYVKASNTGPGDYFGYTVSLSGNTLAVGAHYEDGGAPDSGAVYVFRNTGSIWAQEAYLKASNIGAGDEFGWSVAVSGDTLAVGARYEDSKATGVGGNPLDDAASKSGAVYIFRRTGSSWAQEAYVKASNTGTNDWFGYSVSISGNTLAVGARGEASAATGIGGNEMDNTAPESGAVYLFQRWGSSWTQQAYVKASNTDTKDMFGYSVATSADTLAVGAPYEGSAAIESGAVYVFH